MQSPLLGEFEADESRSKRESRYTTAEIKALATGNPLIVEKCELEMQVGKFQLLKSSFLSQRYDLEDKALRLPNDFAEWFCGHYHISKISKRVDHMRFMYENFRRIS